MRFFALLLSLAPLACFAGSSAQPAGYVGRDVCAGCHKNIAATQTHTAMAQTWQGGVATFQRTVLQRTQYFTDDFVVQRLFASYAFANGMTVQLNVQNLFNERYFTNVRNNVNATSGAITGGWAVPGEARSAVLSLFYSF